MASNMHRTLDAIKAIVGDNENVEITINHTYERHYHWWERKAKKGVTKTTVTNIKVREDVS